MDDTCHEIDRCIIDFVAKVEAITTKKQKAFASMKDGFWAITKARTVAGPRSITQHQYDLHADPGLCVEISELENDKHAYKLVKSSTGSTNNDTQAETGPRRRVVVVKALTESAESKNTANSDQNDKNNTAEEPKTQQLHFTSSAPSREPTLWFGYGAKPQLENAKSKFLTALFDLIDAANMQIELDQLEEKLAELRRKKDALKSSAPSDESSTTTTADESSATS